MQQLNYFASLPFIDALKKFFVDLHLPLHYLADEPAHPRDILGKQFKPENPAQKLIKDIYALGVVDDAVFGAHKSTFDDIEDVRSLNKQYDGILVLGVTLQKRDNGQLPARGQLAEITRALNREFASLPVVVVFRYEHHIAFANCERSAYKHTSRDGEKAGKVSLLRDIDIENVHAGHLRILQRLEVPKAISTFDALYQYWQEALNVSLLNKDFYRDLSNWFFAAKNDKKVKFPDTADNATEIGLIRLITRLVFTWFVKERGLVPEDLFELDKIKVLLKDAGANSDTYYRAILQNLFFATLNTEMGTKTRRFRDEKRDEQNRNKDYAIHSVFRYKTSFSDPRKWLDLIANVPFLNGGLFECLDPEDKDGARVDGFSDVESRQAKLPNYLFWGDKFTADLSDVYNDKKQKTVQVQPLLNLLHSYKFTIAENTPLEQDVALDPELLGKVFENLLASYNPETATTARKQTGSFYTPREIVNYMVEEALSAYLEPHVSDKDSLKVLLSDADSQSAQELGYSKSQIETLVNAINHCTILDPACGSGAFPMGALSKMVMLLTKLDPHNEIWLNSQLATVDKALEAVSATTADIDDAKKAVRDAFHNNDPDYARKLYLIQSCLFGVDIQPIAMQITKLRFFIALIVDQHIIDTKDNRNIRALPNLETKFVAANTLIAPDTKDALGNLFVIDELKALNNVRQKYFSANTRSKKKELREQDDKLRKELIEALEQQGVGHGTANQLAEWDPYDPTHASPFFEPEWMFGVELKEGFDIVIGNPPYVFARDSASKGITVADKKYYVEHYKLAQYQVNLYSLFIEKGVNVLKKGGTLAFITPNNWLTINTNKVLREYVLRQSNITIVNFLKHVFESADVDAAVMVFNKERTEPDTNVALYEWTDSLHEITTAKASFFQSINDSVINIEALKGDETHSILAKMEAASKQLDKISLVKSGLKAYEVGKGIPPITKEMKDSRAYHSETKKRGWDVYLDGKDVCRYSLGWSGEYILYGDNLAAPRTNIALFNSPRILVRQIPNKPPYCLHACYTDKRVFNDLNSMNVINIQIDPLFVLSVLNSKPTSWWFIHKFGKLQRGIFPQFKVNELATFPIPNATLAQQKVLSTKVDKILTAKAADPAADTSALEREIDIMVADLYELDDAERKLVGIENLEL